MGRINAQVSGEFGQQGVTEFLQGRGKPLIGLAGPAAGEVHPHQAAAGGREAVGQQIAAETSHQKRRDDQIARRPAFLVVQRQQAQPLMRQERADGMVKLASVRSRRVCFANVAGHRGLRSKCFRAENSIRPEAF